MLLGFQFSNILRVEGKSQQRTSASFTFSFPFSVYLPFPFLFTHRQESDYNLPPPPPVLPTSPRRIVPTGRERERARERERERERESPPTVVLQEVCNCSPTITFIKDGVQFIMFRIICAPVFSPQLSVTCNFVCFPRSGARGSVEFWRFRQAPPSPARPRLGSRKQRSRNLSGRKRNNIFPHNFIWHKVVKDSGSSLRSLVSMGQLGRGGAGRGWLWCRGEWSHDCCRAAGEGRAADTDNTIETHDVVNTCWLVSTLRVSVCVVKSVVGRRVANTTSLPFPLSSKLALSPSTLPPTLLPPWGPYLHSLLPAHSPSLSSAFGYCFHIFLTFLSSSFLAPSTFRPLFLELLVHLSFYSCHKSNWNYLLFQAFKYI